VTEFDHDDHSPDPRAMPPADPWLDSAPTSPLDLAFPAPATRYDEESPRRSRRGWWVLAFVAVVACLAVVALYPFGTDSPNRAGPQLTPGTGGPSPRATAVVAPAPGARTQSAAAPPPGELVVYEVTSNGAKDVGGVQYTDTDGEIIRLNGVSLPWRTTFRVTGDRHPLVLIAQRKQGATGAVTCRITFDGKLLSRTTQTGRFAAPECSG
jgi:hypothetical protein